MEFNSSLELRSRVESVLDSRRSELKRVGYNVSNDDMWTYLSNVIFPNSVGLTLYDVVDEIMHIDVNKMLKYLDK